MNQALARYNTVLASFLLCSMLFCTAGTKKVTPTSQYYQPISEAKIRQICIVSDWDDVIAHQMGPFKKGCTAASKIPFGIVLSMFFKNSTSIMRAIGKGELCDAQGNRIIGTGACIRFLARKEPRLMRYYTKLLRSMAKTTPIQSTIDLYHTFQQYGIPLIVWTNTDLDLFIMKYKNCNYRLTRQYFPPLVLDGYFGVGQHTDDVPIDQYTTVKKGHNAFYKKALKYSKNIVHDLNDDWIYIYIDDKAENVQAARDYALAMNESIIAIHYTSALQLRHDLYYLLGHCLHALHPQSNIA